MPYDDPNDPAFAPLITAARAAMKNAYAPYSKYHVGAALLCSDGSIVAGCNVENASYGATICAERGAIMTAVAAGQRAFDAAVVITRGPDPASPCGMCRQMLYEFAPRLPILLVAETGARRVVRLDQILPGAFGPEDLRT